MAIKMATHTEAWCDHALHILPVPEGREDPGCHRLIWVGDLWLMIHRVGGRIVVSDDQGRIYGVEEYREFTGCAIVELGFIPRQRPAED